jgi:hypothetical protein
MSRYWTVKEMREHAHFLRKQHGWETPEELILRQAADTEEALAIECAFIAEQAEKNECWKPGENCDTLGGICPWHGLMRNWKHRGLWRDPAPPERPTKIGESLGLSENVIVVPPEREP